MPKKTETLPSYQELAELVDKLTRENIANLNDPESRFVRCFTYGADRIPDHWWRAIEMRAALVKNRIINDSSDLKDPRVIRDRRGCVVEGPLLLQSAVNRVNNALVLSEQRLPTKKPGG